MYNVNLSNADPRKISRVSSGPLEIFDLFLIHVPLRKFQLQTVTSSNSDHPFYYPFKTFCEQGGVVDKKWNGPMVLHYM